MWPLEILKCVKYIFSLYELYMRLENFDHIDRTKYTH